MLVFSPDWDSRLCYLVVFVCALLSARIQLSGRLDILKEKTIYAWGLSSTWFVYSVYLSIPLLLFWFLDRTGALLDTSVFSALLVGLAYPAILSGGTSLKTTDGLSGVFSWLNKATDSLVSKTLGLVALKGRIFERAVVKHLTQDKDSYERVKQLALEYTENPSAMEKELTAQNGARALESAIVYDYATNSVQGLKPISQILKELNFTAVRSPYSVAKTWNVIYTILIAVIAIAAAIFVFAQRTEEKYFVWRLTKPGVSAVDLQRSRTHLRQLLGQGGDCEDRLTKSLIEVLQKPGLEVQRADEILRLLLQFRGPADRKNFFRLANHLIDGLRVSSVDVRTRIHHALLLLADEHGAPNESLKLMQQWEPLATESPIDLERKLKIWSEWWETAAATPKPGKQ